MSSSSATGRPTVQARIGDRFNIGDGSPLALIAGPCVLESRESAYLIASECAAACESHGVNYIFKASFDKANRTAVDSYRGPGIDRGLQLLRDVRDELGIATLTDIHEPEQAAEAAQAVDILQIPALLSRQTDLLQAAAVTGRVVNVKKGQFLAPWDMSHVVEKLKRAGAIDILLTERGTSFGYNTLVVDFRSLPQLRGNSVPVVFDATHSVQLPGGRGNSSDGQREFIPYLARAAAAVGIDALFLEVHPNPDDSPSDGPNMLPLNQLSGLLHEVVTIRESLESAGTQD